MICFQCTRTVGYRRRDFLCDECREAVEPYYAITDEELRAARVLYDRTPRRPGAVIFTGLPWSKLTAEHRRRFVEGKNVARPDQIAGILPTMTQEQREAYVADLRERGFMGPPKRRLPPFWYGFAWLSVLLAFFLSLVLWGVLSWIGVL